MHEGDVATVEGEIMHKPKASALATRDRYYIARDLVRCCVDLVCCYVDLVSAIQ